jgi:hypothetical protein
MKKTLNSFILFATVTSIGFLLIGCGKGSDSNNNNVTQACSTGYYFYNNSCVGINNNGVTQAPGFLYTNGFYADNYSQTSTLRVTNVAKMEEFFQQGMGVCNRAAKNYGTANCSAYSSGYTDIIIQFPNVTTNTLLATFIAQPRYNGYSTYSAQLPSGQGLLGLALGWTTGIYLPDPKAYYGAMKNPLQLELKVSAINNSTGFQAQGYGDFWTGYNRTLIAVQVPKGTVQDNSFNFNFMVQGVTAASGTMSRCRYANCNLY